MRPIIICVCLVGCGGGGGGATTDAPPPLIDSPHVTDAALDAAVAAAPMSCIGLAPCVGTTSCCESPLVSGGTFSRGYVVASDHMFSVSTNTAMVSDFRLDKFPVTVGRFRAFVASGAGTALMPPASGAGANPYIANSGWDPTWNTSLDATDAAMTAALKCDANQTWTDSAGAGENRPITCMNWYEAMAFCAWDGGFLPTEAEWNYAASGGTDQRAYPWSNPAGSLTLDATYASYYDGTTCTGDTMVAGCSALDLVAVGTHAAGDGKFGQSDLAGNAWQLLYDVYAFNYSNPCNDCANLTGTGRVLRGGYYLDVSVAIRTSNREPTNTDLERDGIVGFRCARTP